jgi:energy-coupling factor transport system ATP-binding protein
MIWGKGFLIRIVIKPVIELQNVQDGYMPSLISIENLSFKYPDHTKNDRVTLREINLTISDGEYVCIVGANGSGKSTLARMINALLLPDQGGVRINGLNTREPANLAEIRKTIGMVFQFPEEQIFSSTIEEDVAFGLENFGWEYEAMHKQVQATLRDMGLWDIRQRPSYLLSAGQTQRLALSGVLAIQPRCVIFDEATSMLDPLGRQTVLNLMHQIHENGKTVIHITHNMEEVQQATRVIVLLYGEMVYDGTPADLFSGKYSLDEWRLRAPDELDLINSLRNHGIQIPTSVSHIKELADFLLPRITRQPEGEMVEPETVLQSLAIEVHQLGHVYLEGTPYQTRAIRSTDLIVAEGTCHGLIGVTGSGKSTLLQHLNGLLRPQIGTVKIGPYLTNDPKFNLRELVQYAGLVMQNPEVQFFQEYVGDEIAYGPRTVKISESLAGRVRWAMEQVGMDFDGFKDRRIHSLSGGEKRKVALASILALKPRLLLLDEPTAGLDPSTHHEILGVFHRMVAEGKTIVTSSHNMEDIADLTSQVTVMVDGQSMASGRTASILGDVDQMKRLNMVAPVTARLVQLMNQPQAVFTKPICKPAEFLNQLEGVYSA